MCIRDSTKPGLHFKFPWRQLVKLEKRILEYDVEAREILSLDKRRIVVDNYARWKISDPLQFYKSVRTINGGLNRIDPIIYSELRVELGKHNLTEIVDNRRESIMEIVTNQARSKLKEYGIDLVDVRIKSADLSVDNEIGTSSFTSSTKVKIALAEIEPVSCENEFWCLKIALIS